MAQVNYFRWGFSKQKSIEIVFDTDDPGRVVDIDIARKLALDILAMVDGATTANDALLAAQPDVRTQTHNQRDLDRLIAEHMHLPILFMQCPACGCVQPVEIEAVDRPYSNWKGQDRFYGDVLCMVCRLVICTHNSTKPGRLRFVANDSGNTQPAASDQFDGRFQVVR